jgi:chromosome segregation ATPase
MVEENSTVRLDPRAERPSVRPRSRPPAAVTASDGGQGDPEARTSIPAKKDDATSAMRRQIATLHAQLAEAQRVHGVELEGRVEDADRIEELESRLREADEKGRANDALHAQFAEAQGAEANELGRTNEALRAQLAEVQRALGVELGGRVEDANQIADLERRVREAEAKGQSEDARHAELAQSLVELRSQLGNSEASSAALKLQIDETAEKLRVAADRAVTLQRRIDDEQRKLAESRSRLASVEADLETRTVELEHEQMARIPLELQVEKLQNEAVVAQKATSEVAEHAGALGRDLQGARVDTEYLRGETERLDEVLCHERGDHQRHMEAFAEVRKALGGLLRAEAELESTRVRARESLAKHEPVAKAAPVESRAADFNVSVAEGAARPVTGGNKAPPLPAQARAAAQIEQDVDSMLERWDEPEPKGPTAD